MPMPAMRLRRASRRSAGTSSGSSPPLSWAARAIASSSSGPGMIERLAITRMGHRGDGIADGETGPIYVPYTLPGETAEVEDWPGHPDRRRLINVEAPSAERIAAICPHFGVCGGCALQHWERER